MLALVLLSSIYVTGFFLLKLLNVRWYKLEWVSIIYLFGLLSITWLLFLFSLCMPYSSAIPAACLTGMLGAYWLAKRYAQAPSDPLPLTNTTWWWLSSYIVFWIILFSLLLPTRLLQEKQDGWYSGGSTWGDIALHTTLINSFAQHPALDLSLPVFPQKNLTYPFLFDFYTGLLVKTGLSIQTSLLLTTLLTAVSLLLLLFFLLLRLSGSRFIAWFGASVLFLNGNAGSWYAWQEWRTSQLPLSDFFLHLNKSYVLYPEKNLHWAQFLTDYLLPQRGILVGFSVFLLTCYCLYFLLEKKRVAPQTIRIVIAVLLGATPFFHIHTFFVLCGVLAWFVLLDVLSHRSRLRDWLVPGLIATCCAMPQLYWQFSGNFTSGFTRFVWGWYFNGENGIQFWIRNLGMEFFTALFGGIYLLKTKKIHPLVGLLVLPLTALFIISNYIIFQPNEWDNTKFFLYSHFAFTILTLYGLAKLLKYRIWGVLVTILLLFFLLVGGGIMVLRELTSSWQTNSTADLTVARFVTKNTAPTALFLTADTHNHPIPMLAGRSVVQGYPGWLWTYGIAYKSTEADVKTMYRGGEQAIALLKH
nr:hypothetical protein [Candidatus Woesebacteria bacterium]